MGLQGGKMLLRIDPDDPATAPTLAACAEAVGALAVARPDGDGRAVHLAPRRRPRPQRPVDRGGGPLGDGRRRPGLDQRPHLAQAPRDRRTWSRCSRRPPCRCCCSAARSLRTRTPSSRCGRRSLDPPPGAGHGRRPLAALPARRRRRRRRGRRGGDDVMSASDTRTTTGRDLHVRSGAATSDRCALLVTPESAGWRFSGLAVARARAGRLPHLEHRGPPRRS